MEEIMLTMHQLKSIEHLQKECEIHDQLQLKLNWKMLRTREPDQLDFFHYENDDLVAFLGLYPFGSTVEICGMVKPNERRKAHFKQLFQKGIEKAKHNGFKKILLNAPAGSVAAKAFLGKQSVEYAFSEHQLEWQGSPLENPDDIILRKAASTDYEMRVRLSVLAFGMNEEDAEVIESKVNLENTDMRMIEVNEEIVGRIRVSREEEGQAWIYGFCILPEHQGKGIGRKVLCSVIKEQCSDGLSVHLEVETKNEHALKLYKLVGFKVVHTQDYYIFK